MSAEKLCRMFPHIDSTTVKSIHKQYRGKQLEHEIAKVDEASFLANNSLDEEPTGFTWIEKKGNVFDTTDDALAHCVSRDLNMGAGIALQFKRRYGRVDELMKKTSRVPGGILHLYDDATEKHIFYLVTKDKYWQKPAYKDLNLALINLCYTMKELEVETLSIPLIGCGLDRLEWDTVKRMIWTAFKGSDLSVTVYYYV